VNELLSPEEVAAQCGLSRKAVYRAIERGELPASKLCSRLRVKPADLDAWIDRNRLQPEPTRPALPTRSPASNGLRSLLVSQSAEVSE
jgi:excisionase family DNA binding protein